jgi:predicted short-subunit dehydrogenase-like oxidoreductase (DUF2520 family)
LKAEKPGKIALLGAGNLATHLGVRLAATGHRIIQVYSRTAGSARVLAEKLGTPFTVDPGELDGSAATFLFCLRDDALPGILGQLDIGGQFLVHTSGTVHIDVFKGYGQSYGVLYPLQTFSRERVPDWSAIPLCVEGNHPEAESRVRTMAERISGKVVRMDSRSRKQLHLSGVIASNFSNHMYSLALELAGRYGFEPGLLYPLILETAEKAVALGPDRAQTGPALRGDEATMKEHIEMLKELPEIQKIYTLRVSGF